MKTVEISSYPKSGNTLLRHLVYQMILDLGCGDAEVPMDVHQRPDQVINERKFSSIPGAEQKVSFYKSHVVDNPRVNPTHILYIYRHPLDVLLSTLNFLGKEFVRGTVTQRTINRVFIDGVAKSCEQILQDGEMEFYVSKFGDHLGVDFWPELLGEESNYFKHVTNALENPKVSAIKYEDLLVNTAEITCLVLSGIFGVDVGHIGLNLAEVDKRTRMNPGRRDFFWKSKSGTRYEFFTASQIQQFDELHAESLSRIGYRDRH